MQSGDGMLVRLRAGARTLSSAQLRAVASLASASAASTAGQLELTRRSNLQFRGVRADALTTLQETLVKLGLADAEPEVEQRLALLVSPRAGLGPSGVQLDSLRDALEHMLRVAGPLPGLPSKFGIVLEAGFDDVAAAFGDVRVQVACEHPGLVHISMAGERQHAVWLGACLERAVPKVVWRLMQLCASDSQSTRQRWSQRARTPHELAALRTELSAWWVDTAEPSERQTHSHASLIGPHEGTQPWFGIGVPFGAADAATWSALADLAERYGVGELRATAERSVLLLGVTARNQQPVMESAQALGLCTEPTDPLLRAEACPGSGACASAFGETRPLARTLMRLLPAAATLHVSGCEKGCASQARSDLTLVHAADGCKLGFAANVAQAATCPSLTLTDVHAQIDAWTLTRHERSA